METPVTLIQFLEYLGGIVLGGAHNDRIPRQGCALHAQRVPRHRAPVFLVQEREELGGFKPWDVG